MPLFASPTLFQQGTDRHSRERIERQGPTIPPPSTYDGQREDAQNREWPEGTGKDRGARAEGERQKEFPTCLVGLMVWRIRGKSENLKETRERLGDFRATRQVKTNFSY